MNNREEIQNVWATELPPSSSTRTIQFTSLPALESQSHPADSDITDESSRLLPSNSLLRKRKLHSSLPFLHRKSGFYDEESDEPKDDLEYEGNGLRVWYDDYTTIDWIHDITKDRFRVRKMRSRKAFSF